MQWKVAVDAVLRYVLNSPTEDVRSATLARELNKSVATVNVILERFERAGWFTRHERRDWYGSGRYVVYRLTSQGREWAPDFVARGAAAAQAGRTIVRRPQVRVSAVPSVPPRDVVVDEVRRLVGELVRVRHVRGVTQTELGESLARSQFTVNRLEGLAQEPSLTTIVTWAHVLGFRLALTPCACPCAEGPADGVVSELPA